MMVESEIRIKDMKIGEKGWTFPSWVWAGEDGKIFLYPNYTLYRMNKEIVGHNYVIVTKEEIGFVIEIYGNHKFHTLKLNNAESSLFPVVKVSFIQ